ncbi:MAG TPA: hypothetical protein VEX41_02475, partial [Candidatus Eisenbacteria bacterium]|nr:hypothetical protein [Candidatus Eisenbacteria bacterium]
MGDRAGANAVARRYGALFASGSGDDVTRAGFFLELSHHLLPDDDWLVAETAALAEELGLPVVVTNDVHYARREDRELHDVLTGIAHGRTLETLGDLRRPDGESYLKSAAELAALPPGDPALARADPRTARAWAAGIATAAEVAAGCSVDLGFERYRFPGFPVPKGETSFSYLVELCQTGLRQRYHPIGPAVVRQLAHELDVIERTGLAEFFLICWDLMRFARDRKIPAQGRGSAADSLVAYALGITRVDPIRHNLLFERFINEGRTTYPDVDIDFSSERREEVIQYVYERYGPEHTGMVCNLVTYRARSAVREVGYALGFPRPLVDRVAKALETYDSVMVRRDLEADGGFGEFFRRPGELPPHRASAAGAPEVAEDTVRAAAALTEARGLTDAMGQLNHRHGGRIAGAASGEGVTGAANGESVAVAENGGTLAGAGPLSSRVGQIPMTREFGNAAGPLPPKGGQIPTTRALGERNASGRAPARSASSEFVPSQAWDGMNPATDVRPDGSEDAEHLTNAHLMGIWHESGPPAQHAATACGASAGNPRIPPPVTHGGQRAFESPSTGEVPEKNIPARAWRGISQLEGVSAAAAFSRPVTSKATPSDIRQEPGLHSQAMSDPGPGPSASGMWEEAPESPPAIRPGGRADDEGGPGDTPASVAWLRAGRGTGYAAAPGRGTGYAAAPGRGPGYAAAPGRGTGHAVGHQAMAPHPAQHAVAPHPAMRHLTAAPGVVATPGTVDGRPIDPESGALAPPGRRTDRLGRPERWDPPAPSPASMGRGGGSRGGSGGASGDGHANHSSVARVEPEPEPQPRGGSTVGMSDWERWLEFCARIDGFPRHLSIHSGGMLVTAAPLIDIAPLERATMKDRVVVQFDKRDVETLKLIKLDLLGLGMLAAMDETLQLIEHDCATCIDLDRMPEEIPEVFGMLQAADTVGVFQVESRAQMQTLPKSKPSSLDDLVVEVAIIRPGPIQGNAVHPYLRRKQGLEPVTYLHPSLEPILRETLGVILYQEQVMKVAIEVAGFSPAESDGFRRAMGTWRSNREMEKLHRQFIDGCLRQPAMTEDMAEELFRQVSAFASFGFAKSHAAAFARTAYESAFLKLFYPSQFLVGLINAQPMGFYPVEVLVNDSKRHGVSVLPVDINASSYRTTTEWVGRPGWALAGAAGDAGAHDADPGEELPEGCGIEARPRPVRSAACFLPGSFARDRWAAEDAVGWGVRLGLHLVKGIGEQHAALLDAEQARGPYKSLADVVER